MSSNPKALDTSLDELHRLYALVDHCREALRGDYRHAAHLATMLRESIHREILSLERARNQRESEPARRRAMLRVVS